jgi:hypothetical protein
MSDIKLVVLSLVFSLSLFYFAVGAFYYTSIFYPSIHPSILSYPTIQLDPYTYIEVPIKKERVLYLLLHPFSTLPFAAHKTSCFGVVNNILSRLKVQFYHTFAVVHVPSRKEKYTMNTYIYIQLKRCFNKYQVAFVGDDRQHVLFCSHSVYVQLRMVRVSFVVHTRTCIYI